MFTLSLPTCRTAGASRRPRLSHTRLGHRPELPLELVDLVTQSGRELELELASRRMHLIGELLDQLSEISRRHPGQILGVPADIAGCAGGEPRDRRLAARLLPATTADEHLGVSVL